jgi:hypothetical protein
MRYDARFEVTKALKEKGLYVDTVPNKMSIPVCTYAHRLSELIVGAPATSLSPC